MNATPEPVRHPWLIVARREVMAQLTSKVFWVGTLSTIGVIVLAFLVSNLMAGMGGTSRVAVASDEATAVIAVAKSQGVDVEAVRVQPDALAATVADGQAEAALSFDDGWKLAFRNPTDAPTLTDAVRTYQIEQNAAASGVDATQILAHTELAMVPLDGNESNTIALLIATFAFAILFMFSAMTFGMQIAQSVVTEKESRIVEILAAAVPIRQLLIGKVVGNSLLALSQVVLIVAAALVGMSFTEYKSMIALVAPVAGWFVLFFLVGFASLACLWAAAGSMATRVQDLSQTTTPLTTIIMLVYIVGMFARGTMAEVLSYVPIASTVVMPGRLLNGEATWIHAIASLVVSGLFMIVAIWFGEQVYRRGLLQTNAVMSLKDAFRRTADA